MKPGSPIKLVSELLDLPLYDSDGKYCGIVDDVELDGAPGKALTLKAPPARRSARHRGGDPVRSGQRARRAGGRSGADLRSLLHDEAPG